MNGQVYFYNYDGLKYLTQMNCRNRRGKFKRGTKVTGLTFLKSDDDGHNTPLNPFSALPPLLVTTNDNRLRLFSLGDYSLRMKYKGLKNTHMQIKANFSDDGKYIVCGSEMGGIVVWETTPPVVTSTLSSLFGEKQDRNCSAEMIISSSSTKADPEQSERSGLDISRLIGQRNKKRIQSAFQSLSRKNKSPNQSTSSSDSSGAGISVATTTAVFAPVSAILHCARNGVQGECSPCSNNTSVKSNIPSETSGHRGVVQNLPDASKGKSSGAPINEISAKMAYMKAVKSLNTDPHTDDKNLSSVNSPLINPRARAPSPALGSGSGSKTERDARDGLQVDVDLHPEPSGQASGYPRSLSPGSDKTDDANLFTPTGQPNYPVDDLSTRVIVATDALGFIRVFVRSGASVLEGKKRGTESYNFMI